MSGVAALVAAAGSGARLGLGPKAFVEVGGATLLELASAALAPAVDELVIAVPEEHVERGRHLVPGALVIAGGTDRQSTVRTMLAASRSDVVLVHDVARPFLTPAVLRRVLAAVSEVGAASAAVAPADSVVEAAAGRSLVREALRLVQTPQGFARELLLTAHERAAEESFAATDDAALVRRLGGEVALVEGSPLLVKLTVPADLALFEALHSVWLREREVAGAAG